MKPKKANNRLLYQEMLECKERVEVAQKMLPAPPKVINMSVVRDSIEEEEEITDKDIRMADNKARTMLMSLVTVLGFLNRRTAEFSDLPLSNMARTANSRLKPVLGIYKDTLTNIAREYKHDDIVENIKKT